MLRHRLLNFNVRWEESNDDLQIDVVIIVGSGTSLCYIRGCLETKVDGGRN